MVQATTVTDEDELQQILDLQSINLKQNLSEQTRKEQGFLTMRFNLDMLKALHRSTPSVIVKSDNHVLAYAIVFLIEDIDRYPEMLPLVHHTETIVWRGRKLSDYNYYIMGQICVSEKLRGTGAFDLLYKKHAELMSAKFDCVVTEISSSNLRSLHAHQRVGFTTVSVHNDPFDEWQVLVWDFS